MHEESRGNRIPARGFGVKPPSKREALTYEVNSAVAASDGHTLLPNWKIGSTPLPCASKAVVSSSVMGWKC